MTARSRLIAGTLAVALAASCVKHPPKVAPDAPGLEVPPPPPRIVEPAELQAPEPLPLPQEPARHASPQAPRQRPAAEPSKAEQRPEAAKPEPAAPEPTKPDESSKPAQPAILQTTPSQAEGDVERAIRGVLDRARGDLSHIDYRTLSADARTQYDQAKRFVEQADDALRAKNLLFARNLADKAAAIAAQLAGR